MDPESRKLLEETFKLAQKNNDILNSIRRSIRWSSIARAVYWVFIIGSAIGAYYFIQPYFDRLVELYGNADTVLRNLGR